MSPRISIPSDNYNLPDEFVPVAKISEKQYQLIQEFLEAVNWKCECGAVNCGVNKYCGYCRKVRDAK